VDRQSLTVRLYTLTESVLTSHARGLLVESLDSTSARTGVSVIGAITLLWGTSRIFRGLDVAFAEIYDVEENKSFLAQFRDGLVVAVALALAVATVVAAGAVFALLPDLPYPSVVNPLFLVVGLSIAFYPIYYVFPDVKVRPIEVIPGTVFAAMGWAALEGAFQAYVVYAGRYEAAYGTLGSVLLLLVWLYASGFVLLVGGVLNAVLAGRTHDENALGTPENFQVDDELEHEDATDARQERRGRRKSPERANEEEFDGREGTPVRNGGFGPPSGRKSEDSGHPNEALERASAKSDADTRILREEVERLGTEVERVEAENERLRRERRRLKRNNADLARRLERRRRSIWKRAKQWVLRK
jgi:membrane protein